MDFRDGDQVSGSTPVVFNFSETICQVSDQSLPEPRLQFQH